MLAENAGLIVKNARIYTVDPAFTLVDGMAIKEGRIAAVGDSAELAARFRSARVLDAEGRCIYPGFLDPHSHLLNYGITLGMADLVGARSWAEVVERCREHGRRHATPWLLGRGWDQNLWQPAVFPSREQLDQAFPDQPALLVRIDGHAAVANARALDLAGVDMDTQVEGGAFLKNGQELTGMLIDLAVDRVRDFVPRPDRAARERALLLAQERCLAVGLTSVSDAGLDREEALLVDAMQRSGQLALRVYVMLNPTPDNLEGFVAQGVHATDRLTIRSIKLYADGALGSKSALMLEPYADDPQNRGLQLITADRLDEICRLAVDAGYQVNTHCIGDASVRLVLDSYSRHLEPGNDRRWRIEHAQIVDPADLPRFGSLGIIPSVQTTHTTSDMAWASKLLGARIRNAYRYQDLLRQNGWIPNGSDFPIEGVNPILGFYAGVVRKDLQGHPEEGFQMENALTREQALRAMTIWAARANFEDGDRGSLEAGKWADFVILDRDLMQVPEAEIPGAKVVATFIAGERVYAA